ncbi:YbjN domain-containing protein [Paenibacillus methanolicus]|uniref:Sensory transduction regulator n=1 Tax=Paenibacillus methanolicus TaxID=582686 RepID=A0A5S5CJM1_9BACL|nr:YbjN domain-containing protein [Paenibacillus methanolicus]TYP78203.1 hypothetical protein BCM02_102780 [Paenibacillus methanolicus]
MTEHDNTRGDAPREEESRAFRFRTLTGETLAAELLRVRLTDENEEQRCSLLFSMDWDTYRQLARGEWMGLHGYARDGAAEAGFDAGRPIELAAVLKPAVMAAALGTEPEAEQTSAILLGETDASAMLRQSESWLVTEAKQQVVLPEELAGGSLKRGYRTMWAERRDGGLAPVSHRASLSEVVLQALEGMGLAYERLTDDLIRLSCTGENGTWIALVRTDEEEGLCLVYSVFPEPVPEERRAEAAIFFVQENYDLTAGSFEMDGEDGEVRFRTSLAAGSVGMTVAMFTRLFDVNVSTMDRYFAAIEDGIVNGFAE